MGNGRGEIQRARGALRRVRNGLAEALPALAALEELAELPDTHGSYKLSQGEEFDEADVLAFLRLARGDNPGAMTIIVLGQAEDQLSEVKGQQAADPGEAPHGPAADAGHPAGPHHRPGARAGRRVA